MQKQTAAILLAQLAQAADQGSVPFEVRIVCLETKLSRLQRIVTDAGILAAVALAAHAATAHAARDVATPATSDAVAVLVAMLVVALVADDVFDAALADVDPDRPNPAVAQIHVR